ncbi:MAG: ABC transporter permease [Acetivibrio ethanolgignens]
MKKEKHSLGKVLIVLMILFFYLPILYMIIFSFNEGKSLTHFTGFSLRWYQHMLESRDMMGALYTTFSVALIATFVSTVAGTLTAIGLSKSKKIIRDIMTQVDNLPMMNPENSNSHWFYAFIYYLSGGEGICNNAFGTYCLLYSLCNSFRYAKGTFS